MSVHSALSRLSRMIDVYYAYDIGVSVAYKMVDGQMTFATKKRDGSMGGTNSDVVRYTDTPIKPSQTLKVYTVSANSMRILYLVNFPKSLM